MTIRTIPLETLTVLLRRPFEAYTDANGAPIADKDGEQVFVAEATVGGFLTSAYNLNDRPETVRVRVVGDRPDFPVNSAIRLIEPQATAWFVARQRGSDAKSDLTISAKRVEAGDRQDLRMRGGLPAHTAGVGAMFLGQTEDLRADVVFDASGVFTVDGVAEIRLTHQVPASMVGAPIEIEGLTAFYTAPDNVSDRNRAEIVLAATTIREVSSPMPQFGGGRRKPEPTPEPVTVTEG